MAPPPPHTSGTGEVARELIHRHFVKLQGLRTVDEQLAHDDQSKIKIVTFTVLRSHSLTLTGKLRRLLVLLID